MHATHENRHGYIDALRGYAVLLVIFGHVAQFSPLPGLLSNFPKYGVMGVQLFYVVSALTLTMSWKARQDGVLNFYTRRLFRIAPLFWIAIAFYLALYGFHERLAVLTPINWVDVALTATFTHMARPTSINSVVPGGWSVAVEMSFYLIFPIFMLVVRGWKTALLFVFVSYHLGRKISPRLMQLYAESGYPDELLHAWQFYILPSQISAFAIGIALFFLIDRFAKNLGRLQSLALFVGACALTDTIIERLQYGGPIAVLLYSSAFALFALCLSSGQIPLVCNRWVSKLGVLSYSAYLSHFAFIHMIKASGAAGAFADLGQPLAFALSAGTVLVLTVITSAITHRFIESPGIRLGSKLIRRLAQKNESASSKKEAPRPEGVGA